MKDIGKLIATLIVAVLVLKGQYAANGYNTHQKCLAETGNNWGCVTWDSNPQLSD